MSTVHPAHISRGDDICANFAVSLDMIYANDSNLTQPWVVFPPIRCVTHDIARGRKLVTDEFLLTDTEWLWFIDSDIGFAPDTLDRLLDAADPVARPVMGALCFTYIDSHPLESGHGFAYEVGPTLYRWDDQWGGFQQYRGHLPDNEVVEVDGTGAGCLLIHRSVLEDFAEKDIDPWTYAEGLSEDLSFSRACDTFGWPIHVHLGTVTSHYKHTYVTRESYTPDPEWLSAAAAETASG